MLDLVELTGKAAAQLPKAQRLMAFRLCAVIHWRAGPVRVDVINVLRGQPGGLPLPPSVEATAASPFG